MIQRCLPNVYNQEDEKTEIVEEFKDWLKRNEVYFMPVDLNDISFEKVRKIRTLSEPRTQTFGYRTQRGDIYYILPTVSKKNFASTEAKNL